jgi:predicted AAA+ superfamily ATPase
MKRMIFHQLQKWKKAPRRKPLLLRGARQVGKTYITRKLGKEFPHFVEVNLELSPKIKQVFHYDLDANRIIRDLSLVTGEKIIPGETLLFIDEIQEEPKAVTALRYFYEMIPQLHVIAAGSLLEFELDQVGMPVGRVSSLYLYPLSFMEYLKAKNQELLMETILEPGRTDPGSEVVHEKLMRLLGEYMSIGGMPEAVECFLETSDLHECFNVHRTIIHTYRQDFHKYTRKYQLKYVELLFNSIPTLQGKKFKFSHIPGEYRKRDLQPALDLLVKAGIIHKITHSSGQGIPLAAAMKPEVFKLLFLDVGISQTIMGTDTASWLLQPEINFASKGMLTEAFVGQELLAYSLPDQEGELWYWQKEDRSSNAELDYLVRFKDQVIPVEVKSGTPGTSRSLRLFLNSHSDSSYGIRLSAANYSINGDIHSYPLYSVSRLMPQCREQLLSLT